MTTFQFLGIMAMLAILTSQVARVESVQMFWAVMFWVFAIGAGIVGALAWL